MMKTKAKKLLALLAALAMLVSMAACQLQEPADADADQEEIPRDAIAATIGDTYNITRGEVEDEYNYLVDEYAAYGQPAPTAEADIESMQDMAMDNLVSRCIFLYQADQMGIELTKEETDGVDADVEDMMAYYNEMFRAQAEAEGAEEADLDARTEEIFNEQLAQANYDMNMSEYREFLHRELTKQARITALENKVKASVSVTEEEARAYYDDLLATQKESYEANPELYLEDQEAYEKFGETAVVVVPEGYVRIKTITISPQEELSADYDTLATQLEELEAEYGKLRLNQTAENAARISEIEKEYAEKSLMADEIYEAYISDARTKAETAYAELEAGKSFDEVLAAYGEDDLYTTYPIFATEGILMQKGVESTMYDQALVDAVAELQNGEYTELINVDDMYFIVQLIGDEEPGERAYADVQEEMERLAQEEKAEEYWTEQQSLWNNDDSLVTYYEDQYRSIGK